MAPMFSMKKVIMTTTLTVAVVAMSEQSTSSRNPHPWAPHEYPEIDKYPQVCRTKSRRLCDPDMILNDKDTKKIDDFLKAPRTIVLPCPKDSSSEVSDTGTHLEIAIALVKKVRRLHKCRVLLIMLILLLSSLLL